MEWSDTVVIAIVTALITSAAPYLIGWWRDRKKNAAETRKIEAEIENIHAGVAEKYAARVNELQEKISALELDIAQVRRENESLRAQIKERDFIIDDLKGWAERLVLQLAQHAPNVQPVPFARKEIIGDETLRRLRRSARLGDV